MTVTSLLDLTFIFQQNKWTPLMVASKNGRADVVNVLLQHGASVHPQDKVKLYMLAFLYISPHKYECIATHVSVCLFL